MKNIKTYEEFSELTFKEYINKYKLRNYSMTILVCTVCVTDLDGIEKFTNLTYLDVNSSIITSLEPIRNLTKLEYLFIDNTNISSLEPIKNLMNLKKIWCSNNKIKSLKPILNSNNLISLYCSNNQIDWVDYIDKDGRTYYIKLPKSIEYLESDKFHSIEEYCKFYDQNQPSGISRKFNF